eukprot:2729250-Pleurochrysis_carterae.AAC.3
MQRVVQDRKTTGRCLLDGGRTSKTGPLVEHSRQAAGRARQGGGRPKVRTGGQQNWPGLSTDQRARRDGIGTGEAERQRGRQKREAGRRVSLVAVRARMSRLPPGGQLRETGSTGWQIVWHVGRATQQAKHESGRMGTLAEGQSGTVRRQANWHAREAAWRYRCVDCRTGSARQRASRVGRCANAAIDVLLFGSGLHLHAPEDPCLT